MIRTSLVFLTLMLVFASCGKKLTPVQLDAEIVTINDSLKMKGQGWVTELGKSFMSRNFSALEPLRKDISGFLDEKIEHVENMKDVGGSEEYRQAELDFLKYERNMVETAFMPFEKFDATSTNDQIQGVLNQLAPISDKEVEKMDKISALQVKYAEKNNFKLKSTAIKDETGQMK